jgi:2'-5' RNA ligase
VTRRLFLAVPCPLEVNTYLEKLREANQTISGIKWMWPHNLHLTIYFMGNTKNEDFDKIITTVLPILNSQEKFTLEFDKICFAPTSKPKMIWAKFHKNNSFTQLVNSVHEALKSIIPPDKFYYAEPIPHITLARFHPIKEIENINIGPQPELSKIHVTSCQLWESLSSPNGVKYENAASLFYLKK